MSAAGRFCPPHYGYAPSTFARRPDFVTDTMYVIGGLYGNPAALDHIDWMAAHERRCVTQVFNGDFHWFDADARLFASIQSRVLVHLALRGNVETELAADDTGAGCGCAYPDHVADGEVERSNAILQRLRATVRRLPGAARDLAQLWPHAVAQVGPLRIGIVHGDAWNLAGWQFAPDRLHDRGGERGLRTAFDESGLDGFASSHTCAPALKVLGSRFVINNGAAGMSSLAGERGGLLTRVSTEPLPAALRAASAFGLVERGVFVDALRVRFDADRWIESFDRLWPAGTPASVSYRERLLGHHRHTIAAALGGRAAVNAANTATAA